MSKSIDNQVANMNRDATAIGSSGGASLAALSGAYNKGLDAYNNLAMKDSEIQQGNLISCIKLLGMLVTSSVN